MRPSRRTRPGSTRLPRPKAQTDMFGDPKMTSDTVLRVVDAKEPPLHVIVGSLLPLVKQVYAARIQSWQEWDDGSGGLQAA
jgi:hypothetical protein